MEWSPFVHEKDNTRAQWRRLCGRGRDPVVKEETQNKRGKRQSFKDKSTDKEGDPSRGTPVLNSKPTETLARTPCPGPYNTHESCINSLLLYVGVLISEHIKLLCR